MKETQVAEIKRMSYGGRGIVQLNDGRVCFIEGGYPGDQVEIALQKSKKTFAEGSVRRLLQPSPFRRHPACEHFSDCGGCHWQDIQYNQQLAWKKDFVLDALERIGGLRIAAREVLMTSGPETDYRSRLKLRVGYDSKGTIAIGFYRRGTRQLAPIKYCQVADSPLRAVLTKLALAPEVLAPVVGASLDFASLAETVVCQLQYSGLLPRKLQRELRGVFSSLGCQLQFAKATPRTSPPGERPLADASGVYGDYLLWDSQNGVDYYTKGTIFQQINKPLNRVLRRRVLERMAEIGALATPGVPILDLFCGSGNLSLQLAAHGADVMGVELSAAAIDAANYSLQANGLTARYQVANAWKPNLEALVPVKPYVVLVDPPRSGLQDATEALLSWLPRHMIYVSCDPSTLARDLRSLSACYQLVGLECYDFFPNTYHVETVAQLELRSTVSC